MAGKILTVIVPSYNMELYLPKCIGSLVVDDNELLQKLDVIIVNDGSKDRTGEIAHEVESKYPGVFRVIDKKNGHYGSCINAALHIASGFYVKILDADDWFDTKSFASYLKFLQEEIDRGSSAADLVLNDFKFVSENVETIKRYDFANTPDFKLSALDFRDGHDVWMHAVAYPTQALRDIHYEQLTGITHTDIQWVHLPMTTVKRVAYCPEVLYMYLYLREGNTSCPDEFYRTYHVQIDILKKMIQDYIAVKEKIGSEQELYLKNHIRYRASRAYDVHILERSPLLKSEALVALDDYLREEVSWLYEETGRMRYSGKIPYQYVRAWRKKQRVTRLMLIELKAAHLAQRVYAFVRRMAKP